MRHLSTNPYQPSHVWADRDPFPHEADASCPCGPTLKVVSLLGETGWAMVHPALDPAAYDPSDPPPPEGDGP